MQASQRNLRLLGPGETEPLPFWPVSMFEAFLPQLCTCLRIAVTLNDVEVAEKKCVHLSFVSLGRQAGSFPSESLAGKPAFTQD